MKHFQIIDHKKNTLADNLTDNCKVCLAKCDFQARQINVCPEYGDKRRHGLRITNKSSCFLCCDKTKTTKLFRQKIEALSYTVPDLKIPISEIRSEEQKKVNRLVHNLTSINAHNIQEIYDLVPQEVLAQNWRKQLVFIKEEISKDLDKAALTFLRIAKHNTHMRSEFSIYRKIERDDNIELDKKNHKLRNVLLNTLHTFFSDFSRRNIYVDVAEFYFQVKFDYETVQVALYHLIENATKYTLAETKISISASENLETVDLKFEMISAHVKEEEREYVIKEGFSGEMAKKMNRHGDGIGMWRINQMLEINEGSFEAIFGPIKEERMGFEFSENVFILKFAKS
ncbi:ATP-binding protein [Gangjinia marincola]|uniref:ATP-binding protein n=1 Tax=Gangjinia marincola TaxID=578463 RepID=A0ABP3XRU3_9FLAO